MNLKSIKNIQKIVISLVLAVVVASGTNITPTHAFSLSDLRDTAYASIMGLITNNNDDEAQAAPEPKDDRATRLDAYFAKRDMPLEGHGAKFIEVADKYDIDWRLLPAIAVRESSGGKHMMNNNPFGWGSCKIKFADFDEAIEEVAANLSGNDEDTAKYYKDKTVHQILWLYNGTVIHSYPDEVMDIMEMF